MQVTVDLSDLLVTAVLAAGGPGPSDWLVEAAHGQFVHAVANGEVPMSGPVVRAILSDQDRGRFDSEFRAAVERALRDRDVDQVAEVVCRWWLGAGGAASVVEKHRDDRGRLASLADRDWPEPRPIHVPGNVVNQTGPDVCAVLSDAQRDRFDADLEAALVEAARTFDHRGAYQVLAQHWAAAMTRVNPADREQDRATMQRVKAGTEPVTYRAA